MGEGSGQGRLEAEAMPRLWQVEIPARTVLCSTRRHQLIDQEQYVNTSTIAQLLSFSERTIHNFRKLRDPIPCAKLGGHYRYQISRVIAWADRAGLSVPQRRPASAEPAKARRAPRKLNPGDELDLAARL
jgi:hypothetical protein